MNSYELIHYSLLKKKLICKNFNQYQIYGNNHKSSTQTKLNVNVNDLMKKNEALNNFCLQSHVQPYPPKCRGPTEKE